MQPEQPYTHDDYVRERAAKDPAFAASLARHRRRYEYTRQLIEARLAKRLTQVELARRLGTSQSAVARLEAGQVLPRATTLQRLADVLEVEIRIGPRGRLEVTPAHEAAATPAAP